MISGRRRSPPAVERRAVDEPAPSLGPRSTSQWAEIAATTRGDEAQRAFQALLDRAPRPEVAARALGGQAQLAAQEGKHERAPAPHGRSVAAHPGPGASASRWRG